MKIKSQYIEIILNALFWLFYFTAINVEWSANWFERSSRLNTPSPLSVLIFPIFFYANAFWLIPKYLNKRQWPIYIGLSFLVFILPELIRAFVVSQSDATLNFKGEIFSRDSFLFGAPSPFFLALNGSFIYRFAMDWFRNRNKIARLVAEKKTKKVSIPYQDANLLSDEETREILARLTAIMNNEKPYLNPELSLRGLADLTHTTDKKLSYVLNQTLKSNFYDYLNSFRVEAFKKKILDESNQNLSLVGIALECGFKSKSSFYRAFKNQVGCSPSEYLKKISS